MAEKERRKERSNEEEGCLGLMAEQVSVCWLGRR